MCAILTLKSLYFYTLMTNFYLVFLQCFNTVGIQTVRNHAVTILHCESK